MQRASARARHDRVRAAPRAQIVAPGAALVSEHKGIAFVALGAVALTAYGVVAAIQLGPRIVRRTAHGHMPASGGLRRLEAFGFHRVRAVRAVVITRHGGPEVLQVQERPDPPVGSGEVRIAVKAAGINFADTLARTGLYPDSPKLPCVVGYEVAGEVESVGDGVESVKLGDRVLAGTRFNGQAELVTVRENMVYGLPERLSFEEGAAFPVNYATAQAGLVVMGALKEGERVLIHAAAGGVGISATQIAKRIGAEVFGTASVSKHDAIRAQGVDHPIDYRSQDFAEAVRRITAGEGIDVAFDALGPSSFRKDYRLLRAGGRLIMYGASEVQTRERRSVATALHTLAMSPFASMPWWKGLGVMNENKSVAGLNMLSWWDTEGSLDRVIEPLIKALHQGELKPVVAEAFPFERAPDAHRFIAERRNVGKVVLVP